MNDNQFKKDLAINEHKLNQELLRQPQLYYDYAKLATQAKCDMEDAKDDLEIIKAKIDVKIRKDKEKYDVSTEQSIKSAVEKHPKVVRFKEKYSKKRRVSLLLEKAEKALEQRKRMLQMYVYRSVNNMHSNVKIPREKDRELKKDISRNIRRSLKGSLKRGE